MRFTKHLCLVGVLAGGVFAGPACAGIPDSELAVLRDFYASTGGDNWFATAANANKWFADDTDPCSWFGVGCDATREHVTGFDLSGGNLSGSLPANLATLKNLRYLVVDNNRLSGPLPPLDGLTKLEAVFVQHNQLTGPIPSLAGLTSLGYFAADHNALTGHIPSSLSDLPQLQYFVVDNNQLSGRVPRAPATLTAFSTALCPNQLDTRPSADPTIDAGWNSATGLTPWWSGPGTACAAPFADTTSLHAFATSTTGQGDMHSWAEVVGTNLEGLAAADGICGVRATAANLPDPGTYVAWLSDRNDDAYCRIFGLSGKKADNCGLDALPTGAGPWLRTDEVPFAATIERALADNVVYSSLNVDESGNRFFASDRSYTATDIAGVFSTREADADCAQWSSSSGLLPIPESGSNVSSGGDWTDIDGGSGCNSRLRLTCMQKGSAPDLSGHAQFGHREAFVSSALVTGDLGGVAGADLTCQSLAAAANVYAPSTFKALLASSTLGSNLTSRIEFDGPWYRHDGLLFAHDKAELTAGAVTLPLNVTESGAYVGISVALTGATDFGAPSGFDCGDWTSTGNSQATSALVNSIALFNSNGHNWLSGATVSCAAPQPEDWTHRLFCVSDSDVLFHGEFEGLPPAL
jgi:Leucine rich repeat N-terminal domain